MFKISDHYVQKATKITTLGQGSKILPTKLVIHYTAGSSLRGAVAALKKRDLSYNILIDVDGTVHQARALNRRAGHAGRSNFKADSGLHNGSSLNSSSVAISLVNLGLHGFFSGGFWWHGRRNGKLQPPKVADSKANKIASIYSPGNSAHWDPYTKAQIKACNSLIEAILEEYPNITEIVGHDDVSINDKFDPGPDMNLQGWREKYNKEGALGFAAQVNSPDGELNLRDRPQYLGGKKIATLKQGDSLHIRSVSYVSGRSSAALVNVSKGRALSGWASVDVSGDNKHDGFVYMGYLTKTPLRRDYAKKLLQEAAAF